MSSPFSRNTLALKPEEVRFFVSRLSPPRQGATQSVRQVARHSRWFGIAVRAGLKTALTKSTRANFTGRLAVMDHSDRGIERQLGLAGVRVKPLRNRRLPFTTRLLAGLICCRFLQLNAPILRAEIQARDIDIEMFRVMERLLAGATCFSQFIAVATRHPESWRGTFLSGDVSFLRMFGAFATERSGRELFFLLNNHGLVKPRTLPFEPDIVFTHHLEDAGAFLREPKAVSLVRRVERARQPSTGEAFDIGIVTQNYIDVRAVMELAETLCRHNRVSSVRVRLHPGHKVDFIPDLTSSCVTFSPPEETLFAFSECVDLVIATGTSAIDHLVGWNVPCFGTGSLWDPPSDWNAVQATSESFCSRIPALPSNMLTFLNEMTPENLCAPTLLSSQQDISLVPTEVTHQLPFDSALHVVLRCSDDTSTSSMRNRK